MIRSEEAVQRWLAHLLKNLSDKGTAPATTATAVTPAVTAPPATKSGAPQNPFSAQGAWQNTPSPSTNSAP